ncbi:MAG: TldD/PmbA family protein [Clostridiales bacterium]|jgi:TldD protein|nr:TldD/PmbA family protein [Clostridiales bacterium]
MLRDLLSPYKDKIDGHTELRAQRNINRAVALVAGNVTQNVSSEVTGLSARVYQGGYWGFASAAGNAGDTANGDAEGAGDAADTRAIEDVLGAARRNAAFLNEKLGPQKPALTPLPRTRHFAELRVPAARRGEMLDFARAIDAYIAKKYPGLAARRLGVSGDSIEKLIVTSDGADARSLVPRVYVRCMLCAEADDGSIVEYSDNLGGGPGFFGDVFGAPEALFDKVDALYETLMKKREGVYADAGLRDVILDSKLAGMLAHEAIGHTTEADLVLGGSVAGPNLGKEVASPLVTLVDFANTALGSPTPQPIYVDDEGTVARDVRLIEGGVLKAFMHNRETARHFGHEPTGNARAYLFSDEPLVRMRNTAILPGKDKLEDMIASIDDGYYLTQTGNGQADLTSEFMFSVNMGFEIKKGKLARALRDTTISGVAFDLLKTVTMLSGELTWASSGMCGKKQPIPVGMGGPAVKCRVNIGGR